MRLFLFLLRRRLRAYFAFPALRLGSFSNFLARIEEYAATKLALAITNEGGVVFFQLIEVVVLENTNAIPLLQQNLLSMVVITCIWSRIWDVRDTVLGYYIYYLYCSNRLVG